MTAFMTDTQTGDDGSGRSSNRVIVAGHYEIDLDRPLGTGGMSVVYLGRDLKARRLVALRTLRPEYRNDHNSRARFRQEARRMAFIQHPNVAHVFDYRETDEAPWAVIEYVPGDSLKERVAEQGRLSADVVSLYVAQIADALAQLHDRGLVHLDVKPHNIIVTRDGTLKLIDFGLAQPANSPQELIGGLAYGTAAYLSPEQASGEVVGPASDVYSLACVVYELLTGEPPFHQSGIEMSSAENVRAHLERRPIPPSMAAPEAQLPGWVDELLLWALAKKPADRFDDIRLFAGLFLDGAEGSLSAQMARSIRAEHTVPIDTRLVEPESPPSDPDLNWVASQNVPDRRTNRSRSRSSIPSRLWRISLALIIANAMLAGVLYFQRGTVPGLFDGRRIYRSGADAVVLVAGLNVRDAPGLQANEIGSLPFGETIAIAGSGIEADGEMWWPIQFQAATDQQVGFVWEGGIEPEIETGRVRLRQPLNDMVDRGKDFVERNLP